MIDNCPRPMRAGRRRSLRALLAPASPLAPVSLLALALLAGGCDDDDGPQPADGAPGEAGAADGGAEVAAEAGAEAGPGATAHTLFATEGETLIAIDVATGVLRPGAIANLRGPTDMQATESGHLLVNLTDNNQILVVDAARFQEVARLPSSGIGGTRPVHSFVTPTIAGRRYWLANNDGAPGVQATNSVVFVDLVPQSPTFLQVVGEIGVGIGHHKNALSTARARVSVSNIADCATVIQVIDYADIAPGVRAPTIVKRWSAAELDPARPCDAQAGVSPHGASAASNGHGYHNLTGWGAILAVDQDAEVPTFKLLPTAGNGAGYTKTGKDGRHVYSLQRTPRQGDATRPGAACQVGQLVVIDSQTDGLTAQVPILLTGPDCATLPAHAVNAGPDHLKLSADGKTLFVTTQAAPATGSSDPAYSDKLVVFDLTAPAAPVQKASITVGKHSGHRGMSISGDGRWLFVVNAADNTISQIDVATLAVTRTIALAAAPRQLATWGSGEGPSAQTGPH